MNIKIIHTVAKPPKGSSETIQPSQKRKTTRQKKYDDGQQRMLNSFEQANS